MPPSELLVVDPAQKELLRIKADGTIEPYPSLQAGSTEERIPLGVARTRSGYLLDLLNSPAMLLDRDLNVIEPRLHLRESAQRLLNGLGSMYTWVVHPETNYLLTFGTRHNVFARAPEEDFEIGFIGAHIDESKIYPIDDVRMLLEFPYVDYYVFGHHYLAVTSNALYFLAISGGTRPRIYRLEIDADPAPAPIDAVPSAYQNVPPLLTKNVGPSSTAALFAELETLTIPVGIYGGDSDRDQNLYLLGRTPTGNGLTEWTIWVIEPARANALPTQIRLPTTSAHLEVIPGEQYWHVIERGTVVGWGKQLIKTMLRLPSSWITQPDGSPLRLPAPKVTACRSE